MEDAAHAVSTQTVEEANRLHHEAWAAFAATYGSPFLVPEDVAQRQAELTRARLCLATPPEIGKCPDRSPVGILKYYGFTEVIIDSFGFQPEAYEPPVRRDDKHRMADEWWHAHVGEQIKPQELADAVGWSYPTAINYINDNVTVFFKVKRGLYEVRDPKVERERDKRQTVDD